MEVCTDIIIGDTHGCAEEVRELLRLVGWRRRMGQRLFFLGDLGDRGPDFLGCIRIAQEEGATVLKGNHDDAAVRFLHHERRLQEAGKANPMRPPADPRRAAERVKAMEEWRALPEDAVRWLEALPTVVEIRPGWLAVHAGFEDVPMGKQREAKVIRCRYIDPLTGEMVPFKDGSLEQPPGTVYWTERWKGPDSVVYGHTVHSLTDPRIDRFDGFACYGIDTGCCYGGRLTAMVLPDSGAPEFVQVQAHAQYAQKSSSGLAS